MVLQNVRQSGGVLFGLDRDDECNKYVINHLKFHIAEVQKAWHKMESVLGALGYTMEVQVDKRINPEHNPVEESPDRTWGDEEPAF